MSPAVARIRRLLLEDRWREALVASAAGLARFPADRNVLGARSEVLLRAGRFRELTELFEATNGEFDARAHLVRARLAAAAGRETEAAADLARALSEAPKDPEVLYWAADLTREPVAVQKLFREYLENSNGQPLERIQAARAALQAFDAVVELKRSPWRSEASPAEVRIPLRPVWGRTGSIDGYTVEVSLGSAKKAPVRLLVDTGAHSLFVLERIAKKRQFEPLAEGDIYGGGGDGSHAVQRGFFPIFDLGGLRFGDALATTSRTELDPTGRFHGLLGISVLGGYRVTLDWIRRELLLESPAARPSLPPAFRALERPYWWVAGQLLVEAELVAGEPALFVLDTGATNTVLSMSSVESSDALQLGDAVDVQAFGGPIRGARGVRGAEVRFGESVVGGTLLAIDLAPISRIGGVEISGMLGLDALGDGVLTLDTTRQRFVFSKAGSKPDRGGGDRR